MSCVYDTVNPARRAFFRDRRWMVQDISLDQVAVSLGTILLLWSAIERAARHEVVKANQGPLLKSAHGVSAALNAWEAAVVGGKDPLELA